MSDLNIDYWRKEANYYANKTVRLERQIEEFKAKKLNLEQENSKLDKRVIAFIEVIEDKDNEVRALIEKIERLEKALEKEKGMTFIGAIEF